jgi:ribosome-associated translation inhibitor RaiA
MTTELQALHTEVHPRWRELVERRSAKLSELGHSILRLHVSLVHSTHHLRGAEQVRILATLPGDALKVEKAASDMGDAIHAAFSALQSELHSRSDSRRDLHRRARY